MRRTRVLHVISGLGVGGAERMLARLIEYGESETIEPLVVSLTDDGELASEIRASGVTVRTLGMTRARPSLAGFARLTALMRELKPDVVQTWMYHADLMGGLAAKLAGRIPVAWGIRHSDLDPEATKPGTLRVAGACARLSRVLPRRIICNSHISREIHAGLGYDDARMMVIPNGFDLALFRPDAHARSSVRDELRLPDDATIIVAAGRHHPDKDHATLISAAGILIKLMPDIHVVACGKDVTYDNPALARQIEESCIGSNVHLIGPRSDMPRLLAATDLFTSSSSGEAFPQVVGEAMACGVPCVVTAVGDSGIIVGDTGVVVPPRDPPALAEGWQQLLTMNAEERRGLGDRARKRIQDNYEIHEVVRRFSEVHRELSRAA